MEDSPDTRATAATPQIAGHAVHHARAAAVGEVHARPHPLIPSSRLLVQLAFVTEGGTVVDAAVIGELCRRRGASPPDRDARHHQITWGDGILSWERHSEFSSYTWHGPLATADRWRELSPFGAGFNPPGAVMSGIRLEIRGVDDDRAIDELDPESLCHSFVEDGRASILTDFRQDDDGLTRMFMLDRGLTDGRRGALAQRLIEIETYRVFAMLGLSLAQSLSGQLRRMEDELADLTSAIRMSGREQSEQLLSQLTALAAELEAQAASSLFRFGASRAYHEIMAERLLALKESPVEGADGWSQFLTRRVAPAMRTCRSVEHRQANLSRKLARTTQLLRTWVDVEIEKQNRNLLASMNDRARQQLRLQQTVEGLSVAAISYYVVGLAAYMLAGVSFPGDWPAPKTMLGAAVPFIVLAIWLVIRRIRRGHGTERPAA